MSYSLQRMTEADASETIEWITRQYDFNHDEVQDWVRNLHFNWGMSVKAIDEENNTIALLNMSDYRIEEETPLILEEKPQLIQGLNKLRYISVFSFIVSEQYRHSRLNYEMMMAIWKDLQKYDFVFIPVMHRLKTHSYWKRWGAYEFYRDSMSIYYILPISEKIKESCMEE